MITKRVTAFLRYRLGEWLKVESVKEGNLLSDPPIPQIWVTGWVKINGIMLEFKTTLSPRELDEENY